MKKYVLTALFVFIGLTVLLINSPAQAQTPAQPTPDPTLVAMQQTIDVLTAKTTNLQDQLSLNKQWYELEVTRISIPIAVIGFILAALGISSPFIFYRTYRSRTEKRLNQAIYHADPTWLPIHIPANNFDLEKERLKWMGFKNLKTYVNLTEEQTEGIIVYRASAPADLDVLEGFITQYKAKEKQMAFVVYSKGTIPGAGERVGECFNATLANNSVTMVTHIYALARGLKNN